MLLRQIITLQPDITLPSISCIFSELKLMLREDAQYSIGAPMAMQMLSMSVDSIRNMLRNPGGCARVLATLDYASLKRMKVRIHNRLRNNTPSPRPNEKLHMYLRRRCHRDESKEAVKRFASDSEDTLGKKKNKKKKSKNNKKQQDKLEHDKWGEQKAEGKTDDEDIQAMIGEGYFDGFQIVDEGVEMEEIEKIVESANVVDDGVEGNVDIDFIFAENEIAELNSQAESTERVRVLRELGEGVTVCVKKDCREMCCNCEIFNRWRICRHVVWMEVLHFAKYPPGDISDAEDGWDFIRQRILDIIKDTHIDVSDIL